MCTASQSAPMELAEVLADEAAFIEARRLAVGCAGVELAFGDEIDRKLKEPGNASEKKSLDLGLVGLAFSGGGIRSATFNLGVLQALAELRLLRMFDYLSTISGGGYIGAWLAAWIHRDGEIGNVEKFLTPNRRVQSEANENGAGKDDQELAEPEPVRHLRSYSSYLAPRAGYFSADSWALIAIYLRNLFLNQLVLFPLVAGIVLLVLGLADRATKSFVLAPEIQNATVGLTLFAAYVIYVGLGQCRTGKNPPDGRKVSRDETQIGASQIGLAVTILLVIGMVLVYWRTFEYDTRNSWQRFAYSRNLSWLVELDRGDEKRFHFVLLGLFVVIGSLLQSLTGNGLSWIRLLLLPMEWIPWPRACRKWLFEKIEFDPEQSIPASICRALTFVVSGLIAGGVLGGLLYCLSYLIAALARDYPLVSVTVVPPLFVLSIFVAECLQVGILGNQEDEGVREWWAAFTARLFMGAIAWAAVFTLIVLAPDWLVLVWNSRREIAGAAALGWVATTMTTVLTAHGDKANGMKDAGWRGAVVAVGPFVFLAGWLVVISLLVRFTITWWLGGGADADFAALSKVVDQTWMLVAASVCVAVSVVAGLLLVDVNLWSLHGMYTNRLARCYLGASRKKRDTDRRGARIRTNETEVERVTNSLTGFAADDDLNLADLGKAPDLH